MIKGTIWEDIDQKDIDLHKEVLEEKFRKELPRTIVAVAVNTKPAKISVLPASR